MIWHLSLAYLIDLLVGDPRWLPHPVVLIGRLISMVEGWLRRIVHSRAGLKLAGIVLLLVILGTTYTVSFYLVKFIAELSGQIATLVSLWLLASTLATKSLYQAGKEIFLLLKVGDLEQARLKVGWIVGRDTDNLSEDEVARATVETVAENIVDGITSPLFYAALGGMPLAMTYKAVNTLDSMVGYNNDKYKDFGWASAKFDDLANYIPARITGFLIVIAAFLLRKNYVGALKAIFKDAKKHPSPNSGFSEAGVAGALNIRLGGTNYYGGKKSFRAFMGEPIQVLDKDKIMQTNKIMLVTSLLMLLILTGILKLI